MNPQLSASSADPSFQDQKNRKPTWLSAKRIYVYGTGKTACDVWRILTERGLMLSGYMDHQRSESIHMDGVPVVLPDGAAITSRDQAVIVLAIHNREADIPALIARLQSLGYRNFISMIDLYDYFDTELGGRYWLTRRTFYDEYEQEIAATARLFADPSSRHVFDSMIRFRQSGSYALLPPPDLVHQYVPSDLPPWTRSIRFVDCGAYNGDTLRAFIEAGYQFEAVAAFEPDPENFSKLTRYASQNPLRFPNCALFPCAVASTTTQLQFETGTGEAARVSEAGATVVQCVSLDECIPTFAPDLIKMDIEGAERDALAGAKQLITTYRPVLAISVYHTPAHIWEIPLYISSIARENKIHYTYHLRAHGHNCFDTIFYAIPERPMI